MVIKSVAELPKAPAASDCKIWVMGKIQNALLLTLNEKSLQNHPPMRLYSPRQVQ